MYNCFITSDTQICIENCDDQKKQIRLLIGFVNRDRLIENLQQNGCGNSNYISPSMSVPRFMQIKLTFLKKK